MSRQKTAAIYARYSSKHQSDRSVEDQIALCERLAEREGLKVIATFADRAKSGTTTYGRDELAELMNDVQRGRFDMIITEQIDRLARDQEDMIGIFKQFLFFNVEILTQDGVQSAFHVGIRGLFAELFSKDLGAKVKRHHDNRVLKDRLIPGSVTYGYRRIEGQPGKREPDPATAPIVVRIFQEYAAGKSPRAIARDLTADGIPTPDGRTDVAWNHQTFVGGRLKRGMISNEIYIGIIVWNQSRSMKNPFTKKRVKRPGLPEDLLRVELPELRIIDQTLWNAANKVRKDRAIAKFGPGGKAITRPVLARTQHVLAGLLRCEVCKGHMRIGQRSRTGSGRVVCAAAHQHSTCEHRKSYDLDVIQAAAFKRLAQDLANPEEVAEWGAAYAAEFAKGQKDGRRDLIEVTKKLNRIETQIKNVITAIVDGHAPAEVLGPKLTELDTEKQRLLKLQEQLDGERALVSLHPNVIPDWQANVRRWGELLTGPYTPEVGAAFRNLVTDIYVHPTPKRADYRIRLYGRMSALLGLDPFLPTRTPEEIVAGSGGYAVATASIQGSREGRYSNSDIIPLGQWKTAA